MHRFDYSFLKTASFENLFNLSLIIADLKAKEDFRHLQYPDSFERLRKNAIVLSVKGSNAIEGIVTSDDRLDKILSGEKPSSHDEFELLGYKDALNLIHENSDTLDLTKDLILKLHSLIEAQSHPIDAGKLKDRDNFIMEIQKDGSRSVRFKPVSAGDCEYALDQMILAYYAARQDDSIPQLLLIPCVVFDFLCIHPFNDGNGRVSRLLTVLLLYISGYDIVKYISFENKINEYKENYYEALRASSDKWYDNENDYYPVLINFLRTLYQCYKDVDDAFMELDLKKAKKNARVESIVCNAIVPISTAEIAKKLPDVSIETITKTLHKLMQSGKIQKIGTYKNARYIKAK